MLFSSFWKRGPGPPLWGPGGYLDPWTPSGSAPVVLMFHSRYIMLRYVRNIKMLSAEHLFWLLSYWVRDIRHGHFRLVFPKLHGRHGYLVNTFATSVSHMLKGCISVLHLSHPVVTSYHKLQLLSDRMLMFFMSDKHVDSNTFSFI